MPRDVPAGYFSEGVWARAGPLRLRRFTCLGCGLRVPTWDSFKAHRRVCEVQPDQLRTPPSVWRVRDPELEALVAAALAEEAEARSPALDPPA